jgi:hypothetical protein
LLAVWENPKKTLKTLIKPWKNLEILKFLEKPWEILRITLENLGATLEKSLEKYSEKS